MPHRVTPGPDVPSHDAVRAELERVLASPVFARASRASAFLRYVVESRLAGDDDVLKEVLIAIRVYGKTADYDPAIDSLVRVEAGRLREKLKRYYEEDGRDDSIVIELPKGSYLPDWSFVRPVPTAGADTAGPEASPVRILRPGHSRSALAVIVMAIVAGVTGLAILGRSAYRQQRSATFVAEARATVQRAGDFYLQTAQQQTKRPLDHLLAAVRLYEDALEHEPASSAALVGLTETYWLAGEYDKALYEKARLTARRILALDPDSSDGHFYLGHIALFVDRDYRVAYDHLLAALTSNPRSESLYRYFGDVAGILGRDDEAQRWLERGRRELPDSSVVTLAYVALLARQGRFQDMLVETTALVRKRPELHTAHRFQAQALAETGHIDEAAAEYDRCLALSVNDRSCLTGLGVLRARSGRRPEALAIVDRLRETPGHAMTVAIVSAALGDREAALDWLEAAFEQSDDALPYIRGDQTFASYENEPRFKAVIAKLGLPAGSGPMPTK